MKHTFLKKEQIQFYTHMKEINHFENLNAYLVLKETIKLLSSSEVYFEAKHNNHLYSCNIKANRFGIFRVLIDNVEKKRYQNKANIGEKLQPDVNLKVDVGNDHLTLTITDTDFNEESFCNNNFGINHRYFSNVNNPNFYTLRITYNGFIIEYSANNNLVSSINRNQTLHLPSVNTHNTFDLTIFNSDHVYGLPERLSEFSLKDDSYRLFNLDYFDQVPGDPQALYGSIPMLHSVNQIDESNAKFSHILFSFFCNNSSQMWVDIETKEKNKSTIWTSEGGILDLFFMADNNFYRNFYKIAQITGFAPLPGLFSHGYHQCRWGYLTQEDVMVVDEKMTDCQIPYDVIWLDIDHTDDKKYFTWDSKNFPEMKEFLATLQSRGRKMVTIIDPHIKAKEEYQIANILKENNCLVLQKNELGDLELFKGYCWPGDSYYADFINTQKLTTIYKDLFKNEDYFLNADNIHTWVDMNEPSVFNGPEVTMPADCLHFDGDQYVPHYEVHNIYGQSYHKVTYESLKHRYGNKIRPFVLSRSFYAGSQQFGFIWTGDNKATWEFLSNSIATILTISMCGLSACGADVGGFDKDPTEELMRAWFELGVFYPFFRGHSMCETIRREPWMFSSETLNSIRDSITLRYNLLLYWYTKFFEHSLTGVPIVKPMWLRFPYFYDYFSTNIDKNNGNTSQFVVGEEFIISPYIENDLSSLYLPNFESTHFYDFKTGKLLNNKESIIQLVERKEVRKIVIPGSVITWTEEVGLSSEYTLKNPISLKIYLDIKGTAQGSLYWDDGKSFAYLEGRFIYLSIHYEKGELNITNKNQKCKLEDFNDLKVPKWDKVYLYGEKDKCEVMKFNLKDDNISIFESKKIKLF